jgi:formamidopyrimidine-DNA glycosylase
MKAALMDQRVVAGLGNIYVCEALHRSRIDPQRRAATITPAKADALAIAIKAVLNAALKSGGSSLRDYVNATGTAGYFQHHFDVYGKDGALCLSCKTAKIRRIVQAGRSTFFCPKCQR